MLAFGRKGLNMLCQFPALAGVKLLERAAVGKKYSSIRKILCLGAVLCALRAARQGRLPRAGLPYEDEYSGIYASRSPNGVYREAQDISSSFTLQINLLTVAAEIPVDLSNQSQIFEAQKAYS
jgi:hypothetical protein